MNNANLLLLCASPRRKGTSAMLLYRICTAIGGNIVFLPQKGTLDEVVQRMQQADTIVISGPSYINTYPARLIELLETAGNAGGFFGQKLYGIINGGMPYLHTHRHALTLLQMFAGQQGLCWQGGFVLGGGAMLNGQPLEKHMNRRKIVPAFDAFIQHVASGSPSPDALYEQAQKAPGRIITYILSKMLTMMVDKNIKKYGYDPEAPNWYLRQQ